MSTKLEATTKHAITVLDVVTIGLREALAEQAAGQAAPPINAAVMPCGSTVTNVYEAYEAGKRAVQQQAAEPVGEQVVVGRAELAMVRNALQRDADAGKQSRKEMLEMLDASTQQAAEPSDEDIERILAQTLDEVAKHYGFMHAVDVQADITRNTYLRNAFARAVLNAAPAQQPLTDEQCFRIYNDATHAASIAVFMTRIDAESYGADDKGVSGWLQEAEDRVRRRIIKTKEGGAA